MRIARGISEAGTFLLNAPNKIHQDDFKVGAGSGLYFWSEYIRVHAGWDERSGKKTGWRALYTKPARNLH